MARKSSTTATAGKPAAKKVTVAGFSDAPDKDKADAMAVMAMKPSVNAAAVTVEYTGFLGEQDIGAQVTALSSSMESLKVGDLSRCENMLFGQAHALQAIFVNLARRATKQEYMKNWEGYLRMALKAQNQCRMTLETLATIKNPPVFAKQANINNGGQQQVNNGTQPAAALPGVQGGGLIESLPAPAVGTEVMPTRRKKVAFDPVEIKR